MKKGLFAILAILTIFAMTIMVGCPTDDGGGDGGPKSGYVRITFNPDGGTVTPRSIDVKKNEAFNSEGKTMPTPVRNHSTAGLVYNFLAWTQLDVNGDPEEVDNTTVFEKSVTLKATWKEWIAPPVITTFNTAPIEIELNSSDPVPTLAVVATHAQAGELRYQWFVADSVVAATNHTGTEITSATSTTYALPATIVNTASTQYYYVRVFIDYSNMQETVYSDYRRVSIYKVYVPQNPDDAEIITVRNSSIPLYKFEIPSDAAFTGVEWADYSHITVDYFMASGQAGDGYGRTRLYGSYLEDDFRADTTGLNASYGARVTKWIGLGSSGLDAGSADPNRGQGVNMNNDFILDNRTGRTSEFEFDDWFTMRYDWDTYDDVADAVVGGIGTAKKEMLVGQQDASAPIYLGPAPVCNGGASAVEFTYYVKNVILWHKADSDLNLEPVNLGEAAFSCNNDGSGGGVRRRLATAVPELPCECAGTDPHQCDCAARGEDCKCYDCEVCFPPCECEDAVTEAEHDCTCTPDIFGCECIDNCEFCQAEMDAIWDNFDDTLAAFKTAYGSIGKTKVSAGSTLEGGVAYIQQNSWSAGGGDVFYFDFSDFSLTDLDGKDLVVEFAILPEPGSAVEINTAVKSGSGVTTPDFGGGSGTYKDLVPADDIDKLDPQPVEFFQVFTMNTVAAAAGGISFQNNPKGNKYYVAITNVFVRENIDVENPEPYFTGDDSKDPPEITEVGGVYTVTLINDGNKVSYDFPVGWEYFENVTFCFTFSDCEDNAQINPKADTEGWGNLAATVNGTPVPNRWANVADGDLNFTWPTGAFTKDPETVTHDPIQEGVGFQYNNGGCTYILNKIVFHDGAFVE